MWKHWTCGGLGILVLLSPFLGLPWNVHKVLMVVIGIAIAILSFWSANELEKTL